MWYGVVTSGGSSVAYHKQWLALRGRSGLGAMVWSVDRCYTIQTEFSQTQFSKEEKLDG
jgi:hypothetical protein